jgi:hypothetical protein
MKTISRVLTALTLPLAIGAAQQQVASLVRTTDSSTPAETLIVNKPDSAVTYNFGTLKPIVIQHVRPGDTRGLNVFEAPKSDPVPYTGFRLDFGAAFAQEWQGLQHTNTASALMLPVAGSPTGAMYNANQLMTIGHGFNTALANGYLNVQIAPGIRVAMTSYLSSRHHNETWVKDGYALIDQSPIDLPILNTIMKYATVKVGHFEINYGDQHFRRTDGGQSLFNPFVGNYITDAFTTEIGGELYLRANGFLAMGSMTGGEIKGSVETPVKRSPAYIAKLGWDKQLSPALRTRVTGSTYQHKTAASSTLYTGSRTGSRYFDVLENSVSTISANAWSGEVRPAFSSRVNAYVLNPFVKYNGLEFFGNIETASGFSGYPGLASSSADTLTRTWRQLAGDVTYRFWNDKLYTAYRYNTAAGEITNTIPGDVRVNRFQLAGGWYVNPMMLLKVEWVDQQYHGFPTSDIRNGGQFKGFMVESTLAF